jgi:hypothetical protein
LQYLQARQHALFGNGYGQEDSQFQSWQEKEIFLFSKMSQPVLGPIQPLIP